MKISVIIPVYNVEKYLIECLESVMAQSYKDYEVILVDDGSVDSSGEICDEYSLKWDNFKVLHKNNGGQSSARNLGLSIAQGEYVLFVDSDDVVSPVMLEVLFQYCDNFDIVSFGMSNFVDTGHRVYKPYMKHRQATYTSDSFLRQILLHKEDTSVCSKLFKRSILSNIQFVEGRINEDFLFNIDVLEKRKLKIYCISNILYYYRLRAGSTTQKVHSNRFQFITNAIAVRRSLRTSISSDIEKEANVHLFSEIINFSVFLWRTNSINQFQKEYDFCMRYLNRYSCSILVFKYLPLKDKIKLCILLVWPTLLAKL